ncbi:MAG: hypothetical protein A2542_02615 [Parcubacteria group bacterium RIFOXYD2_FULL_52_8]|nr:MAG: hypothetical protein A2542_02615 [Parcubacteria group bacterium RIFOXYD2_FULL_52_8]
MRTTALRLPNQLRAIYFAAFLASVSYAFLVYIESSFLETFIPGESIGLLFSIAAICCVIGLSLLARLLREEGQLLLTRLVAGITIISSFGLSFATSVTGVVVSFIFYTVFQLMLWVLLDVYLRHASTTKGTGNIRGHYLMVGAIAFACSPFLVGWLVNDFGYRPIFFASSLLLLPLFFVITKRIGAVDARHLPSTRLLGGLFRAWRNKNVLAIMCTNFLLEFFYSWMVIYTPIYLHSYLHMDWSVIGIIFSVMLLPFVLFELPLGKLADTRFGEQEILIIGIAILSASTLSLSFLATTSVVVWGSALFLTRTGASFVEVMNETYFFKHVKDTDADIISLYRTMRPFAYIVGPLAATLVLGYLPMQYLFLVLGLGMLIGIIPAARLRDTL